MIHTLITQATPTARYSPGIRRISARIGERLEPVATRQELRAEFPDSAFVAECVAHGRTMTGARRAYVQQLDARVAAAEARLAALTRR